MTSRQSMGVGAQAKLTGNKIIAGAVAALFAASGAQAATKPVPDWSGSWTPGVYNSWFNAYSQQSSAQYMNSSKVPTSQTVCVSPDPYNTTTANTAGKCTDTTAKTVNVGTVTISNSNPNVGFDSTIAAGDMGSVVAFPSKLSTSTKVPLVVFLGGSTSNPQGYTYLIERAASNISSYINTSSSACTGSSTTNSPTCGIAAAISLAYENDDIIGTVCADDVASGNTDACYTQTRGEVFFGSGAKYPLTSGNAFGTSFALPTSWLNSNKDWTTVTPVNSIVSRLVLTLDYLAANPPQGTTSAFWSQFLKQSGTSTTNPNYNEVFSSTNGQPVPAYPDWTRIVLVGHSQGGGEAGFAASTLHYSANGLASDVLRTVMFSAPQDYFTNTSGAQQTASWITKSPTTVVANFRGLRHGYDSDGDSDEGTYGGFVDQNWSNFGSANSATGLSGTEDVIQSAVYPCLTNYSTTTAQKMPYEPVVTDCVTSNGGVPVVKANTHRYVLSENIGAFISMYPALNAHDAGSVDSIATNVTTTNTTPYDGPDSNPDLAATATSQHTVLYSSTVSDMGCSTGAPCSTLNPNVAYIWDALFTGNW